MARGSFTEANEWKARGSSERVNEYKQSGVFRSIELLWVDVSERRRATHSCSGTRRRRSICVLQTETLELFEYKCEVFQRWVLKFNIFCGSEPVKRPFVSSSVLWENTRRNLAFYYRTQQPRTNAKGWRWKQDKDVIGWRASGEKMYGVLTFLCCQKGRKNDMFSIFYGHQRVKQWTGDGEAQNYGFKKSLLKEEKWGQLKTIREEINEEEKVRRKSEYSHKTSVIHGTMKQDGNTERKREANSKHQTKMQNLKKWTKTISMKLYLKKCV